MTMLADVDVMAIAFLYASVTCLLVSVPLWLLLTAAARRWPGVSISRSAWLLAQGVILTALLVAWMPQRAQFSVLPPIQVSRTALAAPAVAPLLQPSWTDGGANPDAIAYLAAEPAWLDWLARAWAGIYAAGALLGLCRLWLGQRALAALRAKAHRLNQAELNRHGAFSVPAQRQLAQWRLPVWETDATVSPMLVGLLEPCLILPRHLRDFPTAQQQLIVAHELMHLQRRDPLWLHISIVLQTLLWFNPLARRVGQRFMLAQELGCDRQVLEGRSAPERQQYAAALLLQLKAQLKAQFTSPQAAVATLAFGDMQASLANRIGLIRTPALARWNKLSKVALALLLSSVLAISALLQPAFAWRSEISTARSPSAIDAVHSSTGIDPVAQWSAPLAQVRVSSFFGVPRKGLPAGHGGIDFVARTGVPVLATDDGVVVASADLYEGGAKYGKVIMIEHGNHLRSMYAHLDQRAVGISATVTRGQQIGLVGATGKVTGPHLHLEAFQRGQRIDPARLLPGLDHGALPNAMAARAATPLR